MIPIPDSVAFYWADAINRAALDVLADRAEIPPDLTLAEAERFELAGLAARRVRVEYWTLLRALWGTTWGEAVRTVLPGARLLSYGEHGAFASTGETHTEPSVEAAWADGSICGLYWLAPLGHLFTRVRFGEDEGEVELQFYTCDAGGSAAVSNALDLGPDWGEDAEQRRVTRPGLLPLADRAAGIDPAPLAACARGALAALAAALQEPA